MLKYLLVSLLCSYLFYCYVVLYDTEYDYSIQYIGAKQSNTTPIKSRMLKKVLSINTNISQGSHMQKNNISSTNQNSYEAPMVYTTVESLIKKRAMNKTIILYCTDNSYIDLFLNGYYASQLWKYENLAVTCFDRLCYQKLYKLNIPVALLNVESDTSVDITKAAICHTKAFHNKVHYKLVLWQIVINILSKFFYWI